MITTWNSNTVRAGKMLAITAGILVLYAACSLVQLEYLLLLGESVFVSVGYIMLVSCTIFAFMTTYYGVGAMRCKQATKKDFWAGFAIVIIGGAIMTLSTAMLWNDIRM